MSQTTASEYFEFIPQIDVAALLNKNTPPEKSPIFLVNLAPRVEDAIKKIIERLDFNPQTKILAINAPSLEVAISVLAHGATAVVDKNISTTYLTQIEQALQQECVCIRLQPPFFLVFPQPHFADEVRSIQYFIAETIVRHWRKTKQHPSPPLDLKNWQIDLLPQKLHQNTLKELSALINNFFRENNLPETFLSRIEQIDCFLDSWFFSTSPTIQPNCILSNLRQNYHQLEIQMISSQLSESCLIWQKKSSCSALLSLIKQAISFLQQFEIDFEIDSQRFNLRANSAVEAFSRLKAELHSHPHPQLFDSLLRALKTRYEATIQARSLDLSGTIVSRMIFVLIAFQNQVLSTNHFLQQMQQNFQLNADENRFREENYLDAEKLRHHLTLTFGDFARWGSLDSRSHEMLEVAILQEAQTIACQFLLSYYLDNQKH